MGQVAAWFEEVIIRPITYFFTGNYTADNGNNQIYAVNILSIFGQSSNIYAMGGDDDIYMAAAIATVWAGTGNDRIFGVAGGLVVNDETGNLEINGANVSITVNKTGDGHLYYRGLAGASNIYQNGNGDSSFEGATFGFNLNKIGHGNVYFAGAAGGANISHSGNGAMVFYGAAGDVRVNKYGSGSIELKGAAFNANIYHNSSGDIVFYGAAGGARVTKTGDGNIDFKGAAGSINITHTGNYGNVNVVGAAASSVLVRTSADPNAVNHVTFTGAGAYTNITHVGGRGNTVFEGAGVANIINHATNGSIYFSGAGAANIVNHRGSYGDTHFNGAGGANVITHSAAGSIHFNGAGAANVITHNGWYGDTNLNGAGAANVITHRANGNINFNGFGGANILTHLGGYGSTNFNGAGGANVIVHSARGDVTFNGAGLGNVIYHKGAQGNLNANAGGVANVIIREGHGNVNANLVAAGNVSVHVGNGNDRVIQLGGLNTHTHIGHGDDVIGMAGGLNIATQVGNGALYAGLIGAGNVVTKVGSGNMHVGAAGVGNVLTQIDLSGMKSDTSALLLGGANLLTKAGQGDLTGVMAGGMNVATQVGNGSTLLGQLGGGNVFTKVGSGDAITAQLGGFNVNTQVGSGASMGLTAGNFNINTKVGDGLNVGASHGMYNINTHVGSGDSLALMWGTTNVFTKVEINDQKPEDLTAAAMIGAGNIMTHVGNGMTAGLMFSAGNVLTKVGDGATAMAMVGQGNIATQVGEGATFAAMVGVPVVGASANVLTKVGDGTSVALMGASGNLYTHVGDGNTFGLSAGQGNIVTKVGQGDQINVAFGRANVITHVSAQGITPDAGQTNNSYNAAMGDANIVTKVGDGNQVSLLAGKGNLVTHVGAGDSVNLVMGSMANVITKVGDGDTVTGMINGKANILTHVGDGNNTQGIWGTANIVTKVGDGTSASAMKGTGNVVTVVGDGAQAGILIGDLNVVTKVGDGTTVNLMSGKANVNTRVGDGTSVTLMKGIGNLNIHVGDGDTVFASYARNNVSIQIGDGDYYGFTFAKSLSTLADNAKAVGRSVMQSASGYLGSQVISQLIWGAPEDGETASAQAPAATEPEQQLASSSIEEGSFSFNAEDVVSRAQSKGLTTSKTAPTVNQQAPTLGVKEGDKNSVSAINGANLTTERTASGSLAQQAGATIQQGVNQVRNDVTYLLQESDRVIGNGGEVSTVLDDLTAALVSQLAVLDDYIDQGEAAIFGSSNANDNEQTNFASGTLSRVNQDVNTTLTDANTQLQNSQDTISEAELHIAKARLDSHQRQQDAQADKSDALIAQQNAQSAAGTANQRVNLAQTNANGQVSLANNKLATVKVDPKSQSNGANTPPTNRTAATGSGLSLQPTGTPDSPDASFGDFNSQTLNANRPTLLTSNQQSTLQDGLMPIDLVGFNHPVLISGENQEDEDEDEGLTDEQIEALLAAKQANMNLGLKGHWGESVEARGLVEEAVGLKANLRGGKDLENAKKVLSAFKAGDLVHSLIKNVANTNGETAADKIRENVVNLLPSLITQEVIKSVLEQFSTNNTDFKLSDLVNSTLETYSPFLKKIGTQSQRITSIEKSEQLGDMVKSELMKELPKQLSNVLDPSSDGVTIAKLLSSFESIISRDQPNNIRKHQLISEDFKLGKNDEATLNAKFKAELVMKIIEKKITENADLRNIHKEIKDLVDTYSADPNNKVNQRVLEQLNLATNFESLLLYPLTGEFTDSIRYHFQANPTADLDAFANDLFSQMEGTYKGKTFSVLLRDGPSFISGVQDGNKVIRFPVKAELPSHIKNNQSIVVGFFQSTKEGVVTKLEKTEMNLPVQEGQWEKAGIGSSGVRYAAQSLLNELIETANKTSNFSVKQSLELIKSSLLKYERNEDFGYREVLGNNFSNDLVETVRKEATGKHTGDSTTYSPDNNKKNPSSINHILADSSIASIVHLLAANVILGDVNAKHEAKKLFVALAGNETIQGINSQDFATKALAYFESYVMDRNTENLMKAIHSISYAPGNVRYGHRAINTEIGNHFDPIFKVENGSYVLSDQSHEIAKTVDSLTLPSSTKPDARKITDLALTLKSKGDDSESGNSKTRTLLSSSYLIGQTQKSHEFTVSFNENDNAKTLISNTSDEISKTVLTASLHAPTDDALEESSGFDKFSKRPDYERIHEATTEAGDKLTVSKIIDLRGGTPVYRVEIDVEGDESKRISVFMTENPLQADGSIRLPSTTTLMTHGEKVVGEGSTYTSQLDNQYLVEDEKFLNISANDFRNVEHLEAAESVAKNTETHDYVLKKYRGQDEGLGLDMAKNQEQVVLAALRDRADANKSSMGYLTVGKHAEIKASAVEAALSRFGVSGLINGYCRAPDGTPEQENSRKVKVKEGNLAEHHQGEQDFADRIKTAISDVAFLRGTYLDGRRKAATESLLKKGHMIGSSIERKALHVAPKLAFAAMKLDSMLDTSGNLQVQVGDGEFNAAFWGNTNIGIKVGDGGFKAAAFGDNNIFVHVGDGTGAKNTQEVGGYTAFEGAEFFMGQRNVSFNHGKSNDFIVMMDKSVPLPPFQSPFSGPTDVIGYLQKDIARFNLSSDEVDPLTGEPLESNYYDSQNFLWSKGNAQEIVNQISSLDMNSSAEYTTLFDYGSQNDRNTRALQADLERAANKALNRTLAGGNPLQRAQGRNLKDQNFNLAIAGQGADIVMTNGDNQFLFGDNAQSILDTTISSVFGMLSQELNGENGQVGNTMSYDPRNALNIFINQLISRISAAMPDMTLGEALGLGYDAEGSIVKVESGRMAQEDVDAIVGAFEQFIAQKAQKVGVDLNDDATGEPFDITDTKNILGLFEVFGNGNLSNYVDPEALVNGLKSALDVGGDAIKTFQERLLGKPVAEETTTDTAATTPTTEASTEEPQPTQNEASVPKMKSSEVFGFGQLRLPSIFDIDVPAMFSSNTSIIDDMVGLVNSFDGDLDTMQEQMFDFFSESGFMQDDGDLLLSLGNNNFGWAGDGHDLGGFLGLNNNFWGGRGNDLFYGLGENNQGSGNEGNDTAVLMGINNMFFGGLGQDFGLSSGRNGNLVGGDGDDTLYSLGTDSWVTGGDGEDYLVSVGNFNAIAAGSGNDYAVYVGNHGSIDLDAGNDVLSVFGNKNTVRAGEGEDYLRLMGHQGEYFGGAGNDFFWTDVEAQDNESIQGNEGDDTFVLGGLNNLYFGGAGDDNFIVSYNYQSAVIEDIEAGDKLIFSNLADSQIWFGRSEFDLVIYLENLISEEGLFESLFEDLAFDETSEEDLATSTDTTEITTEETAVAETETPAPAATPAFSLILSDYFREGRSADIVLNSHVELDDGEIAYEALTQNALNQLIETMSAYDVAGTGEAFLKDVTEEDYLKLATAWDDTVIKSGRPMQFA